MREISRAITWSCRTVTALLAGVLVLAAAAPVVADPFDVTDEAGYQRLLEAGTAAQIVRFEQSVTPNPRVAASVAAIGVFAARNPLATEQQLSDFAGAYDALLAGAYADDSDLTRSSHLLSAVAFKSRVIGAPSLVGMETNLGGAVLERLGLGVDASSRSSRTVEFERAGQWDFANSAAFGRVLVESLMGVDASGAAHADVAGATAAYLRSQGIEPFPSGADLSADYPEIATALAAVPQTFAAFDAERAAGFATVRADIDGEIDLVMAEIDGHIVDITAGLMAQPDVYEAAGAVDQALLDTLAAERLADMRRISGSRALIDLNALLLAQSAVPDDRVQVEILRDFSAITLETDTTYSDIGKAVEIGGSAIQFAAAAYKGDVVSAIGALTNVVSGIFGIAADTTPTPEEQIFDQVIALRQQVEDLRVEMNQQFDRVFGRFDSIDRQLNLIYTEMSDSLNLLNETTRQIDGNVSQLQSALVDVRVALNRIEQNLYGALFSGFLQDYIAGADFALGFRDRTGADLPFTGADSFNTYESLFFSWSTSFASDNTYAGPSALTLPNDQMASDVLGATPLGVNINNLRQFPALLGQPALSSSRLVNPTIWADTAWSYAHLARENPWYFAKINQNSPSRIGDVISAGDGVANAMANARSQALFDELATAYRGRATAFAGAAAAAQTDCFTNNAPVLGDLGNLDPWADASQSIIGTGTGVDATGEVVHFPGFSAYDFPAPGAPRQTWELFPPEIGIALQLGTLDYSQISFVIRTCEFAQPCDPTMCADLGNDNYSATLQLDLLIDGVVGATFEMDVLGHCSFCDTPCDFADYIIVELYQTTFEKFFDPVGTTYARTNDITEVVSRQIIRYPALDPVLDTANAALDTRRAVLGDCMRQELGQASALRDAALLLSASQDLLDAYSSIGLPETFAQSDVLRAALRGRDGLGLEAVDALFQGHYAADTINPPTAMEQLLHGRMDAFMAEASAFLDPASPDEAHDYLEWTLANLRDVQANAGRLSEDDSYFTPEGQDLIVDGAAGVLANDAAQPGVTITVTLAAPALSGTVMLNTDGSFTYMPNPGFTGQDSFAYFAFANLAAPGNPPNIVTGNPVTVIITVCGPGTCPGDAGCAADLTGDGASDVFDLLAYLDLWFMGDAGAERTGDSPASIDVFDLLAYLDDWFTGC